MLKTTEDIRNVVSISCFYAFIDILEIQKNKWIRGPESSKYSTLRKHMQISKHAATKQSKKQKTHLGLWANHSSLDSHPTCCCLHHVRTSFSPFLLLALELQERKKSEPAGTHFIIIKCF